MPCISKFVDSKAFNSFSCYLVLIFLLNNLQCSTSALSTTVAPLVLSSNYTSSHEPVCSNVKDIFVQRGIAEKDLPAKFPVKGERRQNLENLCCKCRKKRFFFKKVRLNRWIWKSQRRRFSPFLRLIFIADITVFCRKCGKFSECNTRLLQFGSGTFDVFKKHQMNSLHFVLRI